MQHTQIADGLPSRPEREPLAEPPVAALRPALFAGYGALDDLRYDYPLVLIDGGSGENIFRPLSRIIDDILRETAAPDSSGEALRQQVLRLEAKIRRRVMQARPGQLTDLWRDCAAEFIEQTGEAPFGPLDVNLEKARQSLYVDGLVIDCDHETPSQVLVHTWKAMHEAKARAFRKKVDGIALRLTDILKSDHMKSDEAHGAEALASSMGSSGDGSVDFHALSAVLARARPEDRLPEDRVKRIQNVLRVLQSQLFYGPGRASKSGPKQPKPYSYTFECCSSALDANRDRLRDVLDFTKALTVAELEVENKYRAELHDAIFERFDESDLTADQIGLLPSALVCLRDGETDATEIARAFEALACGLPITVLIQTDDILGATSPEPPRNSFGAGTARIAAMAMGLNNGFVLQSSSAHLYRMRDNLVRGMQYDGPTLISIYSGATVTAPGVPAYILSAAATESRTFPAFTYDPSAGPDWAQRFDLSNNPQNTVDWPEHELEFEDAKGQRQSEKITFTFADFAICDVRYGRFCHSLGQADWTPGMEPAADWLKLSPETNNNQKPYVFGIDSENRLRRTVVDDKIIEAARRCNDAWCRLQELAGINNSYALRLLAQERLEREAAARAVENTQSALASPPPVAAQLMKVAEDAAPPDVTDVATDEQTEDTPWIETARCTTCNECTQINSELFAYDENMQAYVLNPDGGTYRQIVEAAESCQVSIIHPGQPRNPQEPNVADLIERAKSFH